MGITTARTSSPCSTGAREETCGSSFTDKLHVILCAVVLTYAVFAGLRTVTDWDLGWQLAMGRWILQHHRIPSTDVFSYTANGRPWIYPVGSGIIFYLVYRIGHYALLSWLGALTCAGTVALLLRRSSLFTAALALLAIPRIALRSTPRAEIFTMVLLAAFLSLLWQHYEEGRARLWLLPLLMLAWVNLHPGFVVGIAMLGGYLLLEGFELIWGDRRNAALDRLARAWPWILASLIATLANPWGWKIYPWVAEFMSPIASHSQWIAEWAAPSITWQTVIGGLSLSHPNTLVLLLLVVAIAIPAALWQRKIGAAALLAGAAYFGIRHTRLEALFGIMAVVIAGAVLSLPLRSLARKLDPKMRPIVAVGACCFLIILACQWGFQLATNRSYLAATDIASFGTGLGWWFPEGAASFLERENIPGHIFNSYSEGGFITWRLGPKYSDYIDGRGTPFGGELMERSVKLMGSAPDSPAWQEEAERYDINAIIVPLGRYQALEQFPLSQFCSSSTWQPVYLDETSAVFLRRQPETEGLIRRLQIDCATAPVPAVVPAGDGAGAFNQWANAAAVLSRLGRGTEALAATEKALAIFPDSAYVHYVRAELFRQMGDLRDAEAQFLSAANLDGNSAASWLALANIYEQQGRLNDAIHAWESAVTILPQPCLAWMSLGYDDLGANRPKDALHAFDQSAESSPAASSDSAFSANLAHGRAMAWMALGNLSQAVRFEEQTVRLAPDRAEDWLVLAGLYDREGHGEDAQRARQRAQMLSAEVQPNLH
jgi:Tfp pilus assembly protein PilF